MKSGEIQQVGTPQEIYNEPVNKYVANFIGESNVISGTMIEDYKVKFDDQIFDCVDFGFKPNEKVDIVIRPEDIDIVPLEKGKITGEWRNMHELVHRQKLEAAGYQKGRMDTDHY